MKHPIRRDEIDDIIRAYFTARATDGEDYDENHKVVVDILRQYPEYANYYLTKEEASDK